MNNLPALTVGRFTLLCFLFFPVLGFSQIGGKRSYEFLNVANNARLAALGGINVSLHDTDVNLFTSNPSLVADTLAGFASVNYQFYVGDIGLASFSYSHKFEKIGVLNFAVQHMSYGTIQGTDPTGADLGDYKPGETALMVSKMHQVNNFRFGATLKTIFSSLAGYRSSALALDLGGVFVHPEEDLTVGLAIKNVGFVLSDYSETSNSKLPFDVQLGVTMKPEHMPVRFSFTAFNLAEPDVTYYNKTVEDEKPRAIQKVLSHINFGAELLVHKNVNVLIGYNYLLHQSLKLKNGGGGAGISFGFAAKIKTLEFVFSRNGYVAGSAGYSFTISTNVNKILKRR